MVLSVVIGRRRWGGSSDGSGGLFDSSSVWRRWFLMVVGAYDIDVAGLINKALPEQLGCQDAAGVTIWISGPSPESVAVRSGSGRAALNDDSDNRQESRTTRQYKRPIRNSSNNHATGSDVSPMRSRRNDDPEEADEIGVEKDSDFNWNKKENEDKN
ncbi:unnamed protein product [Nippostrongylus brasiliensis]|uniref:Uncharacterized protein n=1 Tax=Nippostrongylus brasiliensis TaxID=27835 RepID=A0A0N4YQJ4_NIPBR|nr:unnamed protein product [Nippostrongylus brasiliensis]